MALGVESLDEIGDRIGDAAQAGAAGRLVRHPRGPRQGDAAQVDAAEEGEDRPLPGGGLPGRRRRPEPAARTAGLARRRRDLPQLRADPHQAPGDRQAQPRPLPAPAALRRNTLGMHWQIHKDSTAHHAVAERLGQRLPVAIAIGCDPVVSYAATRAAPRRHRRIPVRRVPARRAGRDGRLPDRAAAGAGARADRAGGLPGAGRAAARGPVRRPHRLLHPGRAVPGAARRGDDHAARPGLPLDRHLEAAAGGPRPRQGHRADLPAAAQAADPGHRRLRPAGGRGLPQLRDRVDPQALPEARAEGHERDLGRAPDVADQADRDRRRGLRRARLRRGRLPRLRQRRLRPRPAAHRRPGRPPRPRVVPAVLGRQGGHRRDPQAARPRATPGAGRRR